MTATETEDCRVEALPTTNRYQRDEHATVVGPECTPGCIQWWVGRVG